MTFNYTSYNLRSLYTPAINKRNTETKFQQLRECKKKKMKRLRRTKLIDEKNRELYSTSEDS